MLVMVTVCVGAEASMVFVGNTKHTVPYMLKNMDLFDELPDKYYDSAFIDLAMDFIHSVRDARNLLGWRHVH
jgi:predicted ATP-dependent Lon-type protease